MGRLALAAVISMTSVPAAKAAADAPAAFPETVVVDEAFVLNLDAVDLGEAIRAIHEGYLSRPISGLYRGQIARDLTFATVRASEISYSFRVSRLQAVPKDGRLTVQAVLANLAVNVGRVTFNESGTRYCRNLSIYSGRGTIPLGGDLRPAIVDKELAISLTNQSVSLTSDNFHVRRPSECRVLLGFNWLIRRLLPFVVEIVRDRIADGIASAMASTVENVAQDFGTYLQFALTWPLAPEPFPAFYATIAIWPSNVQVSSGGVRFLMGSDLTFDPDPVFEPGAFPEVEFGLPGGRRPSYFGVRRAFFDAMLEEANAKGLFEIRLDSARYDLSDLLTVERLAEILPDAAQRFATDAEVAVVLKGARAVRSVIVPGDGAGEVRVELELDDFRTVIEVNGEPYYVLTADVTAPFAFGYDPGDRRMAFGLLAFERGDHSGSFARDLTPRPVDESFDHTAFNALIGELEERLLGAGSGLIELTLPPFTFGGRQLELLGASARDDAVALDAWITRTAQ